MTDPRTLRRALRNLLKQEGTVIYGRLEQIRAQKTQEHLCDDECLDHLHRYKHDFGPGAVVYGLSDGTLIVMKGPLVEEAVYFNGGRN